MDYVTRQFIVLTKKFRKELPKLTKLIHYDLKEHTEAIHAANKSNEQQYKIQQEWFEKVLPKKEKAKGDEATDGERHYRVQNSIRWATWSAVIAASIYAAITLYVAKQTRRTADYAERQANIAQRAFDEAHKNFLIDQRAWVGPSGGTVNLTSLPILITINIKNSGKTPAIQVRSRIDGALLPASEKLRIIFGPDKREIESGTLFPDGETRIWGGRNTLRPESLEGIKNGDLKLYTFVEVQYRDAFNQWHYTHICIVVNPNLETMAPCEIYNDAD